MELERVHEAESDVHDNIHFTARSLEEYQAARSVRLLGDWLTEGKEPDLICQS